MMPSQGVAMRRTAVVIVGILVLSGGAIRAHHGYANFFMDRTVSVEGELQSIRWANPHVVLELRAADSTIYTALFHQGASWFDNRQAVFASGRAASDDARNNYFPLTRQSLKAGDHVIVLASPPRDPSAHELVSIKEVRRPRDGWSWKRSANVAKPG